MISNFFLMSYKKAVTLAVLLGLSVPIVLLAADMVSKYESRKAIQNYESWLETKQSHDKSICNRLENFTLTKNDVQFIKSKLQEIEYEHGFDFLHACIGDSGFSESGGTYRRLWTLSDETWLSQMQLKERYSNKLGRVVDKLIQEGNIRAAECATGCIRDIGSIQKPDDSPSYMFSKTDIMQLLFIFLGIATTLLCIFATGRILLKETHTGWRRLTIVVSLLMAISVPIVYFYDDDTEYPDAFFISLAALIGTIVAMILGRKLFFWIKAGFQEEGHDKYVSSPAKEQGTSDLGTDSKGNFDKLLKESKTSLVVDEHNHSQGAEIMLVSNQENVEITSDVREAVSAQKPSSNYFLRHWNGELSLPVSYWVNSLLIGNGVAVVLIAAVMVYASKNDSLRVAATISIFTLLSALAIWLWSLVGVWRSADNHVARGGAAGWANVAKVIVFLGFLGMAGNINDNVIPQLKELTLIAVGSDPLGKIDVKVSGDGKSVIVIGAFREGSAHEVIKILDAAPSAKTLVLHSNGGRLHEAKLLANEVRKRNLNTYVKGRCESACTYVFLAGKNRASVLSAKIGFHQPNFPGLDATARNQSIRRMLGYYKSAGLTESFIKRIGETPAADMWYPTRNELIAANVITREDDNKKVRIVVTSQDAEGVTQQDLDIDFLKAFEAYTVERVKLKTKEILASQGYVDVKVDVNSEATYVYAGSNKLIVIRLDFGADSSQVFIAGIVGIDLKRIVCIRESKERIPLTYGVCADKIKEVFGAKIGT